MKKYLHAAVIGIMTGVAVLAPVHKAQATPLYPVALLAEAAIGSATAALAGGYLLHNPSNTINSNFEGAGETARWRIPQYLTVQSKTNSIINGYKKISGDVSSTLSMYAGMMVGVSVGVKKLVELVANRPEIAAHIPTVANSISQNQTTEALTESWVKALPSGANITVHGAVAKINTYADNVPDTFNSWQPDIKNEAGQWCSAVNTCPPLHYAWYPQSAPTSETTILNLMKREWVASVNSWRVWNAGSAIINQALPSLPPVTLGNSTDYNGIESAIKAINPGVLQAEGVALIKNATPAELDANIKDASGEPIPVQPLSPPNKWADLNLGGTAADAFKAEMGKILGSTILEGKAAVAAKLATLDALDKSLATVEQTPEVLNQRADIAKEIVAATSIAGALDSALPHAQAQDGVPPVPEAPYMPSALAGSYTLPEVDFGARTQLFFDRLRGSGLFSLPGQVFQGITNNCAGDPVLEFNGGETFGMQRFDFSTLSTVFITMKAIFLTVFAWIAARIITMKR